MNWWLGYQIVLALGLILALVWAYDARRLWLRVNRLFEMRDGPPTEELEFPPTMAIGPRLEEFGPGKPVPVVPMRENPMPKTPPPGFAISERVSRKHKYRSSW